VEPLDPDGLVHGPAQRTVRETWRRHIVGLLDQALERNDAELTSRIDAEAAGKLESRVGYYKELTGAWIGVPATSAG
jgi:hypothetical protein